MKERKPLEGHSMSDEELRKRIKELDLPGWWPENQPISNERLPWWARLIEKLFWRKDK